MFENLGSARKVLPKQPRKQKREKQNRRILIKQQSRRVLKRKGLLVNSLRLTQILR